MERRNPKRKRYENVAAVPHYLGGDLGFEKQSRHLALGSEVGHGPG